MSSLGNRNRCKTLLNTSLFPDDELRSSLSCHSETQMFLLLSRARTDGGRLPALHPRTRRETLHRKMPFNLWNKAATGIQNIINVILEEQFLQLAVERCASLGLEGNSRLCSGLSWICVKDSGVNSRSREWSLVDS